MDDYSSLKKRFGHGPYWRQIRALVILKYAYRLLFLAAVVALLAIGVRGGQAELSEAERLQRLYELYRKDKQNGFAEAPEVQVRELQRWLRKDEVVLVDVREPYEQEVSTLPGAVTVQQFEKNPGRFKQRRIAAYCTLGTRSGWFTVRYRNAGFNVYNLAGGLLAWTHQSGGLVDDGKKTNRLHVYGRKWDLAAGGYETVR